MNLLHDLIRSTADRFDDLPALTLGRETLNYGALADRVSGFAAGLLALGLARSERVAVYL
jgi:non-ribosomal peptide synthetase component E (peptide arylation enzyme)